MTIEQKRERRAERAAWAAKHAELIAEAIKVVVAGKCPTCGAPLKRNLALPGWFQCEQYGAVGFRKDSTKPACGFQTFTE